MIYRLLLIAGLLMQQASAQELYVYMDPASNVPAHSLVTRFTTQFLAPTDGTGASVQAATEMDWGVKARWMLRWNTYWQQWGKGSLFSGSSLYSKYRFYSEDDIHQHFRLAAFGKLAGNRYNEMGEMIDLNGMHSGTELGIIATALKGKTAVSVSTSLVSAFQPLAFQKTGNKPVAFNYSLSAGKLLLPREYSGYQQTNLNLMLELLAQTNAGSGRTNIDWAPSIQLIFKSRYRIDFGYRFPWLNQLSRVNERSFLVRLEMVFFNVRSRLK